MRVEAASEVFSGEVKWQKIKAGIRKENQGLKFQCHVVTLVKRFHRQVLLRTTVHVLMCKNHLNTDSLKKDHQTQHHLLMAERRTQHSFRQSIYGG